MRNYLKKKAEDTDLNIRILTGIAESIPFPDNKFDAAVSTLVLCSVDDVEQSLSEILRVLKPGGRFYFIEHVAAPDQSRLRTLQNWITPLWKFMTDGCHPNRDTAKYIRKSGFKDLNIERTGINLPVVSPHIIGSAAKPA